VWADFLFRYYTRAHESVGIYAFRPALIIVNYGLRPLSRHMAQAAGMMPISAATTKKEQCVWLAHFFVV